MSTAENDQDPISAASAGLRALGVAPQRRVETLGLLSALIDLADADGEVPLDTDLMATEERLGIDACLEGYDWLERLDVIRRTYSGWTIQNYAAHRGPVGMTEAAMSVLQKHMETREEPPTAEVPVVTLAPPPDEAPVVILRAWRRRVPVIAASVAAGVAVLAGATQFVPQAAVTGRNAAVHSSATSAAAAPTVPRVAPVATGLGAVTTAVTPTTPAPAAAAEATTTTTSTTLLPSLPCLGDVLRDLGSRTGLRTSRTTAQGEPGLLPCP